MANRKTPPWGVKGGLAGRTGSIVVNPGQPDERRIPGFSDGIKLKRGDLVRVISTGGGGYGDALERTIEHVADDVADGFVSIAGALTDYGVVIHPDTLEADTEATARERARLRAARKGPLPFYDRGPQFEELERRYHEKQAAQSRTPTPTTAAKAAA
jgi:N-methylhydantoinase B